MGSRGGAPAAPWRSTKIRWKATARAYHPAPARSEKTPSSRRVRVVLVSFLFFLLLCLRVFDFFLGPHVCTISVSDPHLDAKIFPIAHPYGTGSLNCESSSVHPQRFCRNRLLALQPFFRRSSRYAFWMLDMSIKRQLFFGNLYRGRRCPRNSASAEDDRFAQVFGTVVPHSIVESTSWWKRQSYDLVAICDDAESGRPSTYSHHLLSMSSLDVCLRRNSCTRARGPTMHDVWRFLFLRHYAIDGDGTQQSPCWLRHHSGPITGAYGALYATSG